VFGPSVFGDKAFEMWVEREIAREKLSLEAAVPNGLEWIQQFTTNLPIVRTKNEVRGLLQQMSLNLSRLGL